MAGEIGNGIAGFALYKTETFDWEAFTRQLKDDWGIVPNKERDKNALVFEMDNMTVALSFMEKPIPNGDAEKAAAYNVLWVDGPKAVKEHKTYMMLAVINKIEPLAQATLFAKIACSLMKQDGAIGVYKDPTVYEKQFYIDFADTIKQGECPMPILIYAGIYRSQGGFSAFTSGLRFFGFEEMEIIDSKQEPDTILSFLLSVSEYVITQKAELKDGETIGFTEEQKIPIKVSEGVSVTGNSVKLGID